MKRRKNSVEIETALLDYLMEGESNMAQAAHELRKSPDVLFRVATRLKADGLLQSRLCRSEYGRPEMRWSHARTRKAA